VSIRVTVNGETRKLPAGATIASVVELFASEPHGRGVAVALGGEVVPRAAWGRTELPEGAKIEVVAAVQGG
jgi:sulfur carrier protein